MSTLYQETTAATASGRIIASAGKMDTGGNIFSAMAIFFPPRRRLCKRSNAFFFAPLRTGIPGGESGTVLAVLRRGQSQSHMMQSTTSIVFQLVGSDNSAFWNNGRGIWKALQNGTQEEKRRSNGRTA
jgi:hypothetical protein